MSRDLNTLRDWASARAQDDPDMTARPLWGRIRAEVDAFLEGEAMAPSPLDTPFLELDTVKETTG